MGTGKHSSISTTIVSGVFLFFAGLYFGKSDNVAPEIKAVDRHENPKVADYSTAVRPAERPHPVPGIHAATGSNTSDRQPHSDSKSASPDPPLTPELKAEYYELSSRMISDLASEATTLPKILNSEELSTLPLSARMYVIGNILIKINNKELDINSVWPE